MSSYDTSIEKKVIEVVAKLTDLGLSDNNNFYNSVEVLNLIEDLEFTSIEIITLIVLLEETFNIIIIDEDLNLENFQSVKSITELLSEKYITDIAKDDNKGIV